MKPHDELSARARALAETVAGTALNAPVRVQVTHSGDDWHQTLLRRIFAQEMTVWRAFTLLDVIVDGSGRAIGFVDHEAYRRADDTTRLTDEEVRALVLDDELLPPHVRILDRDIYPAPDGGQLVAVTVEGKRGGQERRWLVEINAARKLVAAVRPVDV
jgi:hypothetical protein